MRDFSGPLNDNMITSIEDINPCRVLVKMRIYPLPRFKPLGPPEEMDWAMTQDIQTRAKLVESHG